MAWKQGHTLVREYRCELIALLTGASVMMLEIVGARLIAPYFGTSTYVWTAMIGVILGSLAFGYWYGGRVADFKNSRQHLAVLLIMAAVLLLVLSQVHDFVLRILASASLDIRIGAFMAALLLFGPPSALIGAVSPHLAKIRVTSVKITGKAVGQLEAAGAIGSITGTFLCGYILLGWLGSQAITVGVALLLIAVSLLADRQRFLVGRIGLGVIALILLVIPAAKLEGVLSDTDSSYARYQVKSVLYKDRKAIVLQNDNLGYQSGVYEEGISQELPFSYTQRFMDIFNTLKPSNVLMIGGGTYVIPSAIAERHSTPVTVVEIDPALDHLAARYFHFTSPPSVKIVHEDGRTFLNRNQQQFSLVLVDAYQALTPPFQLTTKQAVAQMKRAVKPRQLVAANVIGHIQDGRSTFLEALQTTYRTSFTHTTIIRTTPHISPNTKQNFLLLASDSQTTIKQVVSAMGASEVTLPSGTLVLSDDYAPIERLTF